MVGCDVGPGAGSVSDMLVELAVGDAYGAGFEYADREVVARASMPS